MKPCRKLQMPCSGWNKCQKRVPPAIKQFSLWPRKGSAEQRAVRSAAPPRVQTFPFGLSTSVSPSPSLHQTRLDLHQAGVFLHVGRHMWSKITVCATEPYGFHRLLVQFYIVSPSIASSDPCQSARVVFAFQPWHSALRNFYPVL